MKSIFIDINWDIYSIYIPQICHRENKCIDKRAWIKDDMFVHQLSHKFVNTFSIQFVFRFQLSNNFACKR